MADTPDIKKLVQQAVDCIDIIYQTCVYCIAAGQTKQAVALAEFTQTAIDDIKKAIHYSANQNPINDMTASEAILPTLAEDSSVSAAEFDEYMKRYAENDAMQVESLASISGAKKLRLVNSARSGNKQYLAIANLIVAIKDKEIVTIGTKDDTEPSAIKYEKAMFNLGRCEFKKTDGTVIPLQDISIIYTLDVEDQEVLRSEFGGD